MQITHEWKLPTGSQIGTLFLIYTEDASLTTEIILTGFIKARNAWVCLKRFSGLFILYVSALSIFSNICLQNILKK